MKGEQGSWYSVEYVCVCGRVYVLASPARSLLNWLTAEWSMRSKGQPGRKKDWHHRACTQSDLTKAVGLKNGSYLVREVQLYVMWQHGVHLKSQLKSTFSLLMIKGYVQTAKPHKPIIINLCIHVCKHTCVFMADNLGKRLKDKR